MKKLIFQFSKRIIPSKFYDRMRQFYYRIRLLYYNKTILSLSEEEFRELLTDKLNIKRGVDVFIYSSFRLLKFSFPVSRAIAIVQEIVGDDATILFPTVHFSGRGEPYLRDSNSVFNVLKSPSMLGILSELARRQPGSIRSWHPINSVVAIGKHAREYVENQHRDIYPCGKKSPYYKLVERKGRIIGLGVSTKFLTFIHCVEDMQEFKFPIKTRLEELFSAKVVIPTGEMITVNTLASSPNIMHRNIPKFIKKNITKEIAVDMKIKGVPYYSIDAFKLYYEMGRLSEKNITPYSYR